MLNNIKLDVVMWWVNHYKLPVLSERAVFYTKYRSGILLTSFHQRHYINIPRVYLKQCSARITPWVYPTVISHVMANNDITVQQTII